MIHKIENDADFIVGLIIDAQFEESYEIIDHSFLAPTEETDTTDYLDLIEELYLGEIIGIDPKTKILTVLEPGIYEYQVAVKVGSDNYQVLSSTRLSDEEAKKHFGDIDFIKDAEL